MIRARKESQGSVFRMLKFIRKHRHAAKIPMIIMVIVLSVGLLGSFIVWQSPVATQYVPDGSLDQAEQTGEVDNLKNSIAQYQDILKTNPEDLNTLLYLANSQFELGGKYLESNAEAEGTKQFNEAVATYQQALELDPANIEILTALATAAFYGGQYDLAETYYQKALAADPQFLPARRNYGLFLYYARQDVDGAIAQWEAALATKPDPEIAKSFTDLIAQAKK